MDIYLAGTGSPMNKYLTEEAKKMDLYLAGTESRVKMFRDTVKENIFSGTKILQSFYYCNEFTEQVIIPSVDKFMLDSGAFTFFGTGGKDINWDEWVVKYADFINRNKVDLFFELDIDAIVGYDKVKYYRRKLESLTGKPCIPVWHKNRGKEDFIQMCKDYDYVALGGLTEKGKERNKFFPWFIDTAHKHGAKIHGLGFTSLNELPLYHFDSVDSTSWTAGNRFGIIYAFDGKTMVKHVKNENQRLADARSTAVHNFKEWVKFQKYAETHL